MPGDLDMDIRKANRKKEEAGFMGPYWSAIVCWPVGLPPNHDQPMYIFQMAEEVEGLPSRVYVGTRDGYVGAFYDRREGSGVEVDQS